MQYYTADQLAKMEGISLEIEESKANEEHKTKVHELKTKIREVLESVRNVKPNAACPCGSRKPGAPPPRQNEGKPGNPNGKAKDYHRKKFKHCCGPRLARLKRLVVEPDIFKILKF